MFASPVASQRHAFIARCQPGLESERAARGSPYFSLGPKDTGAVNFLVFPPWTICSVVVAGCLEAQGAFASPQLSWLCALYFPSRLVSFLQFPGASCLKSRSDRFYLLVARPGLFFLAFLSKLLREARALKALLCKVAVMLKGNFKARRAFLKPLGLRDSSWGWDWTSNPGTWGHVGARFPLGGVVSRATVLFEFFLRSFLIITLYQLACCPAGESVEDPPSQPQT